MENFKNCPHYTVMENLEKRVGTLEISDATKGQKIENLIEKIDSLTSWIKALIMLFGTSLVGFFFWYIQNLGNKNIGG
ncbi:MAG: hemolysin XhlA family protein [Tepidibacter sp.]|jgi:hypothetical protein|uniref:hypothetical protein n=1 Tax=Tepidibacter sp. TaxID=2529387 RepID=UPI0025D450B4|nr:hypothetical protein [Tepidibacter sp.]MCT4507846.1 hemolysin XhlA family protein [Tepidibacter sp.]